MALIFLSLRTMRRQLGLRMRASATYHYSGRRKLSYNKPFECVALHQQAKGVYSIICTEAVNSHYYCHLYHC